MEQKARRHQNLPQVQKAMLAGDTLVIEMDSTASEFRFIGQGGTLRSRKMNSQLATYIVTSSDTYIRAEIAYPDGTTFYLNPVARYTDTIPSNPPAFRLNAQKTWLIRGLTFSGLVVMWIFYRRKKSNRNRHVIATR